MARHGLLTVERGADAEWAATDAAEAELPTALTQVLQAAERAVLSRPMRRRIADAARTLAREAAPPADPAALLAIAGETR